MEQSAMSTFLHLQARVYGDAAKEASKATSAGALSAAYMLACLRDAYTKAAHEAETIPLEPAE